MVNLKQRLSEGDISIFLRRSRNAHRPLTQSKSCPVKTESVSKVVRDTVGMIAESEREVEAAARQVENIIKRERRAIAEFEQRSSAQGGRGTIRGWLSLKRETDKNRVAALQDVRRATTAMKQAEEKVAAIGDKLEEEEQRLQERATELRRKSCDLFKLVHEKPEMKTMVDTVEEAEHARVSENGELRNLEVTSL